MATDKPEFDELMRVAIEAAGGRFAAFCLCRCGQPLMGVVVTVGEGTEVIALACQHGHRVIRICNGVLVGAQNIPDKPTDELLGEG